jgi:hypothetical protein
LPTYKSDDGALIRTEDGVHEMRDHRRRRAAELAEESEAMKRPSAKHHRRPKGLVAPGARLPDPERSGPRCTPASKSKITHSIPSTLP